jgi:hypothetical protein
MKGKSHQNANEPVFKVHKLLPLKSEFIQIVHWKIIKTNFELCKQNKYKEKHEKPGP